MRLNTQTNLCYMIPNAELGGFYLSKVAFQGISKYISHNVIRERLEIFLLDELNFILGDIGDKREALVHYDTQDCVTNKEVALWKKTIDRLDMNYHPYMIKSYKLERQIQIVEKLALDEEHGPPPINSIEKSCE